MRVGIIKFAAATVCVALGASFVFALGPQHTNLRVIQTQTFLIRHKATELQRRVAENNAEIFFKQLTPEKKGELKKKKVHAVLIRTARSRETSPAAKDVRMRYSVEGESLIDDYAYEFATPLEAGTITNATGIGSEYVGM